FRGGAGLGGRRALAIARIGGRIGPCHGGSQGGVDFLDRHALRVDGGTAALVQLRRRIAAFRVGRRRDRIGRGRVDLFDGGERLVLPFVAQGDLPFSACFRRSRPGSRLLRRRSDRPAGSRSGRRSTSVARARGEGGPFPAGRGKWRSPAAA